MLAGPACGRGPKLLNFLFEQLSGTKFASLGYDGGGVTCFSIPEDFLREELAVMSSDTFTLEVDDSRTTVS